MKEVSEMEGMGVLPNGEIEEKRQDSVRNPAKKSRETASSNAAAD
jgi:hypothetical protein